MTHNGATPPSPDRLTWTIIRGAVSGAVRAIASKLLELFCDSS